MRRIAEGGYEVVMKLIITPGVIATLALLITLSVSSQGTFQNLDFESAVVPDTPSGSFDNSLQPVADALPGWIAYVGPEVQGAVYHNEVTIGSPSILLFGPNWTDDSFGKVLEGRYSVKLISGYSLSFPNNTVAIAQIGQIPDTAKSIVFYADVFNLRVTFDGSLIPIYLLGSATKSGIWGGDVSAIAGQTGELTFTASPLSPNGFGGANLDYIRFSDSWIPEPNITVLLIPGLLSMYWRSTSLHSGVPNLK